MSFARLLLFVALLTVAAITVVAQSTDPIVAAIEAEDWQTARSEIRKLRAANEALFRDKNYEYLLGRVAERTGDTAGAIANYQAIATNNSRLKEYALWRLSKKLSVSRSVAASKSRLDGAAAMSCCKRSRSSTRSPVARAIFASRHNAYSFNRELYDTIAW